MTRKANPELPIRILEQAQQVVERLGHAGLNMRDLADRVGISATAIYHYYESKEQMMVQLKLRAAELLNARIRAIDLEGDPMEALHRLGEEYLAFAEENPNLYTLLFETQVGERPYSESEQPVLYFTYYTARNLLRRVAEGGALPDDHPQDPRYGAMMGWIMLHGFCSLLRTGSLELAEGMDRDQLRTLFLRFYGRGGT